MGIKETPSNKGANKSVTGFYPISKEGVLEDIRIQMLSREMLISTLFGLSVVLGMRLIPNMVYTVGLVVSVFIIYYVLGTRKGKLPNLSSGVLMYYTENLDRQVIRIYHYGQNQIKTELFTFGVKNIIYLELLGIVLINNHFGEGLAVRFGVTIVGILAYMGVFNHTLKVYTKKLGKELTYAVDNLNQGIHVSTTPDEKKNLKEYFKITESDIDNFNLMLDSSLDDNLEVKNPYERKRGYMLPVQSLGKGKKDTEKQDMVKQDGNLKETSKYGMLPDESSAKTVSTSMYTESDMKEAYEMGGLASDNNEETEVEEPYIERAGQEEPYVTVSEFKKGVKKAKNENKGEADNKKEMTTAVDLDIIDYQANYDEEDDEDVLGSLEVISDVKDSNFNSRL